MSAIATLRNKISLTAIALGAIFLVTAFFRFYRLDQIPPGMHFDEAFNYFDLLRLMQGEFAIFFPANNGREPLFFYLGIVGVALFGTEAIAFRSIAAIFGTVTVGLSFGFARTLFRSTRIGLLTALFMAISVWHIYYSRYGLRTILGTLFVVLTLWWFWRGLTRQRTRDFIFAGVCASLTVYTYLSGRLLPFIFVLITLVAIFIDRTQTKIYLRGLLITGIVAFVIFIPLGVYFVEHPNDFLAHSKNLSLSDPNVSQGSPLAALQNSVTAVAGMFLVAGDSQWFRNVANRPVFDPFIGTFFVIGIAAMLVALLSPRSSREERLRACVIAICLLAFLSASVFSDAPPNFTRTLAAVPFAMVLAAWGASALWNRLNDLPHRELVRPIATGVFGVIVVASTAISFRDYLVEFGTSPALYLAFDVEKIDAAHWINNHAAKNQIYLAPLWYQQGTLGLFTRNTPFKSFESRDTIVLPANTSGKDALYAFPLEQEKKADKLGERLGALAKREIVTGSTGLPMMIVYRVPSANLPNPQSPITNLTRASDFLKPQKIDQATWGENALELLGYSVDAADSAKRNLEVTLFFHALKPMNQDYTFSIKVRDAQGRVWGQEDKWLGNNSYATTQMSAGDVIIEKFYPGLSACAPGGEYTIQIEAYDPKTMQVLALANRPGNSLELTKTRAEASPGNLYEHLEPDSPLDVEVSPRARLFGYSLTPDSVRAGDSFSLSLFWRGVGDGKQSSPTMVRLQDATRRDFVLVSKNISLPVDGRGLCTLFDVSMPKEIATGPSTLFVNETRIMNLNVMK